MRSHAPVGRIAAVVASALLLPVVFVPSSWAAGTVTAPEFLGRIDRARALAEAGEREPRPAVMDAVRDTLGLPTALVLSGGTLDLGTDTFLDSLRGEDAIDYRLAIKHLDVMLGEIGAAAREPALDPSQLDRALEQAYSGLAERSLLQRFGDWVRARLAQILDMVLDPLRDFDGVGSVVAWVVLAGVAALVVLVLRRLGLGLVPERAASAGASGVAGPDWELIADDAMRRNDLREATRALYHVLVGTLATRRILTGEPSTTAGECRAAVARSVPGLYPSVSKATDAFERVAYGGADPDPSDVEAIRTANREAAR